jgi:hypothetical protein
MAADPALVGSRDLASGTRVWGRMIGTADAQVHGTRGPLFGLHAACLGHRSVLARFKPSRLGEQEA